MTAPPAWSATSRPSCSSSTSSGSPAKHATSPSSRPVAWAATLDEDDLATFAEEFAAALLRAASGGLVEAVEDLLDDWRITAEALSDEDLTDELLEDADEPLTDVEL